MIIFLPSSDYMVLHLVSSKADHIARPSLTKTVHILLSANLAGLAPAVQVSFSHGCISLPVKAELSAFHCHIRSYPLENSGSRLLSHRQASEGRISSWLGDDQRIPAVVCFCTSYLRFVLARHCFKSSSPSTAQLLVGEVIVHVDTAGNHNGLPSSVLRYMK